MYATFLPTIAVRNIFLQGKYLERRAENRVGLYAKSSLSMSSFN